MSTTAPAVTPSSEAFNFKANMPQPKGTPADFMARVNQKGGGEIPPVKEQPKAVEEVPPEKEPVEPAVPIAAPTPKTGFVKNLVSTKQDLESKLAEAQARIKEYEEAKVPELTGKVTELETKLNEATSAGDVTKLSKQLEEARAERDAQVTKLSEENQNYRSRLDFHEIQESPLFKEKFVAPLSQSYDQASKSLSNDKEKITELNRAIAFHAAALKATDQEEQNRQILLRDDTLNSISEGLNQIQQARFGTIAWDLMDKLTLHDEALQNHQQTVAQIKAEQTRQSQEAGLQNRNRWNSAMKSAGEKVAHSFPEDIQRVISANKIEADPGIDSVIASSFVENGAADYTPEEVCRLVQQGTQFKPLKGHIAAQEALIAELTETISKLKGGGTGGGGRSEPAAAPVAEKAVKTPAQLFERFSTR